MNNRIIGKVARFTVNLCDFMMGYHGKMMEEALDMILIIIPTVFFLMWFAIVVA